jgi:hypothetical protein
MMKTTFRCLAIATLLTLFAHQALATPVLSNPSGTVRTDGGDYTVGFRFVVGANSLSVDMLGIWDNSPTGLLGAHDVAIWTDTGTLVGSVTVPSGTSGTLIGDFRYATLSSPVTLTASTAYRIGAHMPASTGEAFLDPSAFSVTSAINTVAAFYGGPGASIAFVVNSSGVPAPSAYLGPNFNYSVVEVPEPNSLLLLSMATVGMIRVVRRRRLKTDF